MTIKHHTRAAGTDISRSAIYAEAHDIENGTIGTDQLANLAVTEGKIADGAVTSAKIAADTVIAADIAAGGVGASELATDAVETLKIKDLNVTTGKLADAAVTNVKILDDTIIPTKLQPAMEHELDNIGHMEKFFTDEGWMQCYANKPSGIYYNGKTYITYQRYDLKIYAIYFDHTTRTWSDPVFIANNVFTEDFHGSPVIMKDDSHYLHVFFGIHVGAGLKHYKSNAAESVAAWTAQADVNVVSGTYPNIVRTAALTFYIIYRGTTDVAHYAYVKSTDNMATFGAPVEFADMGYAAGTGYAMYVYSAVYDSTRNAIHLTWYLWDYTALINGNIYHAYLDLDDGHVYSISGADYGVELSKAEADAGNCLVFNSLSGATWACSPYMVLDAGNLPNVIYNDGGLNGLDAARFKFKRWNGAAWTAAVTLFDVQADMGVLILDGTTLEWFCGMQPFGSGGGVQGNQGTGSIAAAATSAVITHGCGFTPTAAEITVTLTEDPTNTPGAIYVDTITATQFTVHCENVPGASNLDFSWMVRHANALYRGQSIWKLASTDSGATWILEIIVLGGYEDGYGMWYPTAIMNWHSDLKVLFHDVAYIIGDLRFTDADYQNYVFGLKTKMYCFGDNGFVMRRHKWV